MNTQKGFSLIAVIALIGVLVIGGGGYIMMNPQVFQTSTQKVATDEGVQTAPGDHEEGDQPANEGTNAYVRPTISWKFTAAAEVDGMPRTTVALIFNGTSHTIGTFTGSCSQISATGGIDGKGLLAGEQSAVQCWYAGGGDEIGVFAHEDGGFEVMVGGLSEGAEGAGMFRGDFSIRTDIKL